MHGKEYFFAELRGYCDEKKWLILLGVFFYGLVISGNSVGHIDGNQ